MYWITSPPIPFAEASTMKADELLVRIHGTIARGLGQDDPETLANAMRVGASDGMD